MKEIVEINSFEEYLRFIKKYSESSSDELWYRGHASNVWELKPNLFRVVQRQMSENRGIEVLRYKFVNFKDVFLKLKNEIIEKNLYNILGMNDFSIMFLAQHYGLLTPTLDWTIDPLIALFFAVNEYQLNDEEYPVIYILKTELNNECAALSLKNKGAIPVDKINNEEFEDLINDLDRGIGHIPIAVFSEKNFSYRTTKQSGKFTLHQAVGPNSWKWNDTIIEGDKIVDSIKINPKAIKEMKEYLVALNITYETVYTEKLELDDVCSSIKTDALKRFRECIRERNEKFFM